MRFAKPRIPRTGSVQSTRRVAQSMRLAALFTSHAVKNRRFGNSRAQ
jgi:hypothetical protein